MLQEEASDKLAAFGPAGLVKPKDVLVFTRNLKLKVVGGQQLECECMFCHTRITSTGASRVVAHFSKDCVLCPPSVKDPCAAMRSHTESNRKGKVEHNTLVRAEQELALTAIKAQKREQRQQSIRAGFKSAEATAADDAIAHFFFANGLNFGAADCTTDSYYREMVVAIQAAPAGYVPPNAKALAGPLVERAHKKMLDGIDKRDADGELSRKFGCSYTSDGWDSCDNLPLINSAYILANDGGVYQRSVDTSGHSKDAAYCAPAATCTCACRHAPAPADILPHAHDPPMFATGASLMIADIYEIGPTKVVMLVTDTCAVMRKCWGIVQDEFPWISCAPCQTHCPSLLLGDICKMPTPAQIIKDEALVVSWFVNHHKPLAILRQKVAETLKKSCELKRAGATRMGTNTWVGERLLELKSCLQQVSC
jgi:hypothetical protein